MISQVEEKQAIAEEVSNDASELGHNPVIEEERPLADPSLLVDRVPPHLQASRALALWVGFFGFIFLILSYLPLWHTEVWGHVAYGEIIWNSQSLPATEALLPLAKGVSTVDSSWLSELAYYGMNNTFGTSGLQFLYALCVTASLFVIAKWCYRRTESVWLTLFGMITFMALAWVSIRIVRPELAGVVAFTILVSTLMTRKWTMWHWIGIPVLFALWANLHISWTIGMTAIGLTLLGHIADIVLRTRSVCAVLTNSKVVRSFCLLELAAVAVLINPYGLGIYFEAYSRLFNENLADLVIYDPLTLRQFTGQIAAVVGVIALLVYRGTPRRVGMSQLFVVVGCLIAAMWSQQFLVWWAPIIALFLVQNLGAVLKKRASVNKEVEEKFESPKSGMWSVVMLGLAWIFIAYTPFGLNAINMIKGKVKTAEAQEKQTRNSMTTLTPFDAVKYWNENPQPGLIYNAFEYGDYMVYAMNPKPNLFVTSKVHNVPREVWEDYLHISRFGSSWDDKLDRYGVNTIFIDHATRSNMIERLKRESKWYLEYDDGTAAIFVRRNLIGVLSDHVSETTDSQDEH